METILKLIEAGWSVSFEPFRLRDNIGNVRICEDAIMIRLRNSDYALDHILNYFNMKDMPAILDTQLQLIIEENGIILDKEE